MLVLLIAAGVGYYRSTHGEETPTIVTASVTSGDVIETVDATGTLQAVTTVQVGTQVSGTIKALRADFNSRVRRGQVIAELEPSLFEAQVEQARASLVRLEAEASRAAVQREDAQRKLRRAQELAERQLIPATELEAAEMTARQADASVRAAEAQVVQARASLNQSQVNLAHTIITAPIDGIVISRNVDVGQTVAASMQAPTLFVIARRGEGGPPLAVQRRSIGTWPITVRLSDADAMLPGIQLATGGPLKLVARISATGQPLAASGDLFGEVGYDFDSAHPASITIDRIVP